MLIVAEHIQMEEQECQEKASIMKNGSFGLTIIFLCLKNNGSVAEFGLKHQFAKLAGESPHRFESCRFRSKKNKRSI